jgi:hypothetical protein
MRCQRTFKRKHNFRLLSRRALSPIFATMLLAAIVIVFGSVAYYFSSNLTTTTTNNYVSTLSGSQQAIAERISFENVVYNRVYTNLTVYIINSGSENNVKIYSIFLYDASHNVVTYYQNSGGQNQITLLPIGGGKTITVGLNVGKEAQFTISNVKLKTGVPLTPGSIYTIELTTQRGSMFDYEFAP